MMKLSRTAWIAIAAVAAVPTSFAIAKTMDGKGWGRSSPETRARLDEGRIAMAKAALKLTPDQEKLFAPVEEQVRASFKSREEKRAERDKLREQRRAERGDGEKKAERGADRKRADLAERFEKMSERMSERADRMKAFSGAFKPFYASLSDEQKDVLRPLIRDLAPGFARGGKRWAHGGGWGPGGREHGDHRRWRGNDEGPRGQMDEGPGPRDASAEPPAPQESGDRQ